jgi:outer membrane protein, heavy metal efflux system
MVFKTKTHLFFAASLADRLADIHLTFDPRSLHFRTCWLALGLSFLALRADEVVSSTETDSLTLEIALAKTFEHNPTLAAHHLEIKARDAHAQQMATAPNPEFNLEAENFAGSGSQSGIDGLETTVGVAHLLELGGKRAARTKLAGADKKWAEWDLKAAQLHLEAEVRSAFTDMLAAQEKRRILQEGLEVNQHILETAKLRHQAGKAPATEEVKARMAYSLTHIEIDRTAQELRAARIKLASFWSGDPNAIQGAHGDLRGIPDLPMLESLLPQLNSHPDLARWQTEIEQHRFTEAVAKAERLPDLTVGAGIRHLNQRGNGDVALVAALSMPLPFFNRNQGSIREAGHRLAKSEKEKQAIASQLAARLLTLHESLQAKREEIAHLKEELLPDAEKTLQTSHQAYQLGKLSFLEVLDSQRTRYELSTRYIATLAEYHKNWNEIQTLVSTSRRNTEAKASLP